MMFAVAVTRFTAFYGEELLTYIDLVGGQTWRMAWAYLYAGPVTTSLSEEAEQLSVLANFLNTALGEPVRGLSRITGFGLPHLQLLAQHVVTDLRHYASIAGANLQTSKQMRKVAKDSAAFSSVFKLLSCRTEDDAEALHKLFGPFASLAVRIGAFIFKRVKFSFWI